MEESSSVYKRNFIHTFEALKTACWFCKQSTQSPIHKIVLMKLTQLQFKLYLIAKKSPPEIHVYFPFADCCLQVKMWHSLDCCFFQGFKLSSYLWVREEEAELKESLVSVQIWQISPAFYLFVLLVYLYLFACQKFKDFLVISFIACLLHDDFVLKRLVTVFLSFRAFLDMQNLMEASFVNNDLVD